MSHAGLAIVVIGLGAWIGLARGRAGTSGGLGAALAVGSIALAFHLIELLAQ
jgi:hypothetical protein